MTPAVKLAVFDVDGTLLDSTGADDACFVQAFRDEFGIRIPAASSEQESTQDGTGPSFDWSVFDEVTDPGLARTIVREALGREVTTGELERLERRFHLLMRRVVAERPEDLAPIAGAEALLERLIGSQSWVVAIATGAWRSLAELKLAALRLPAGVAVATASDDPCRTGIVRTAMERAWRKASGPDSGAVSLPAFEAVVAVGDGLWDLETARRLGIGFVGVGSGKRREKLLRRGAAVVADFSRPEEFVALADREARRPAPTAADGD